MLNRDKNLSPRNKRKKIRHLLRPQTHQPSATLFFIALGLFGMFATEFSAVGIMPIICERHGVSTTHAGLLVSVFAAVVALCGPVMVLLLSRFDSKLILVISLSVFCVCNILSAWAPSFSILLALRVPSALMLSLFFSVAFAAAVSLYPADQAARATAMALMGETAGLIFGAPVLTLIATTISYEASYYFCALGCGVAALGLALVSIPTSVNGQTQPSKNLVILREPEFLIALFVSVLLFGALYSVYSYTVEFLSSKGFDGQVTSMLMLVFGIGGLVGTFLAGRVLDRSPRAALLTYPTLLSLVYLIMDLSTDPSILIMSVLCASWGMVQMGLVVTTQFWVTSAGSSAPQFATSIFVSSANVGITTGAGAAGFLIASDGLRGSIWAGWLFSIAALITIVLGIILQARKEVTRYTNT